MILSPDPKTQAAPRSTRRLAVLFDNEGGSVPECRATLSDGMTYRFIDPSWQPEKGHPWRPCGYQSPAWCAHEVLVSMNGMVGIDIWRTLTEAETEDLNGTLWPEVYAAIKEWARG